jgi:hypothetical protein
MLLPVNPHRPAPLLLALLLAACGGGSGGDPAVVLTPGAWTWVDVRGTACADGTQTGLAVNLAPGDSTDLVVYLEGGGACWDALTCFTLQTAVTGGPYDAAEWARIEPTFGSTPFDRSDTSSPFAQATWVFVPYCTGDVHWGAGQLVSGDETWRFGGRENLVKDLAWLSAHLPVAPGKLVVSGSSAGGYGTLLAHLLARTTWPDAKGYLIDDSGPPLVGDAVPPSLRSAWYAAWGLESTLGATCPGCADDLSLSVDAVAAAYPDDRLALLSYRQDATIRYFMNGMSSPAFDAALLELVGLRITPHANARAFLLDGTSHVLLPGAASIESGGVNLADWLDLMLSDDAGWATVGDAP